MLINVTQLIPLMAVLIFGSQFLEAAFVFITGYDWNAPLRNQVGWELGVVVLFGIIFAMIIFASLCGLLLLAILLRYASGWSWKSVRRLVTQFEVPDSWLMTKDSGESAGGHVS